jgi:rhodanese-related sulfurtransferase
MSYAGDIPPEEAWRLLKETPEAQLVDVRTAPEWSYVGLPALDALGKQTHRVSWQIYPAMQVNPDFVAEIRALGVDPDQPVVLLCRSGVRSKAGAEALTAAGFTSAYNISGGFEGNHDALKHRGTVGGWKVAGLPWTQG